MSSGKFPMPAAYDKMRKFAIEISNLAPDGFKPSPAKSLIYNAFSLQLS